MSQFIHKITRPGDSVILCGDFNHEESETGVKMVKTLARLKDAWNSCIRKVSKSWPFLFKSICFTGLFIRVAVNLFRVGLEYVQFVTK